jgi:creatinine amidohydrolase
MSFRRSTCQCELMLPDEFSEAIGIGETSLLWHLCPDLVAIDRIERDPDYGIDDTIKQGASPELGRIYADLITKRLASLARMMRG